MSEGAKRSFAPGAKKRHVMPMENPERALEDARRAGIDLDLLDSNLALSYEERVLRHASALAVVVAYEREYGIEFTNEAIIRQVREGVEFLLRTQRGCVPWFFGRCRYG